MLSTRLYRETDEMVVRSLGERTFPFPNLRCPEYRAKHVVESNGQIVGFGCLKLTCEGIIIVGGSKRIRVKAFDELVRVGIFECQKLGLKDIHAFLTGPDSFGKILEKHYGFEEHQNPVLVLEL